MQWSRAEQAYLAAIFGILAIILWAGGLDVTFYFQGEATISAWLRSNPRYFFWPLAGTLIFLGILTAHLFLF